MSPLTRPTAQEILDAYWDGGVPVDPVKIANAMGIKVVSKEFADDTICETAIVDGKRAILINASVSGVRRNWAIAHSLGHLVLHAPP